MELHQEIGAVRREVVLDAPRDAVWELLAQPEGLAGWLADEVELDAVAPGERGTMAEGGETRLVTVEEVEERRRVALSWCAPGGDPSLVELTLEDADDGEGRDSEDGAASRTRLVVIEVPLVALRTAATVAARAASRASGPQMAALAA